MQVDNILLSCLQLSHRLILLRFDSSLRSILRYKVYYLPHLFHTIPSNKYSLRSRDFMFSLEVLVMSEMLYNIIYLTTIHVLILAFQNGYAKTKANIICLKTTNTQNVIKPQRDFPSS